MPASLERAGLLLEQSRFDLAEREVRGVLAEEPENPIAHAWLAMCLAERKNFGAALESAREAVGLAPDEPYPHYILARVLMDAGKLKEALAAIQESIGLDPDDADSHATHADLLRQLERPKEALAAAERGLAVDPEHVGCNNLRAIALVNLGRKGEAGATIQASLSRNPENSTTHANMGWTLLHQGKPKDAMGHFAEALRLDPDSQWARAGIVEAIKARNVIYRPFLAYFLFMSRLGSHAQWGIILGAFLGMRVLRAAAVSYPAIAPFVTPISVIYLVWAVSSWLAYPLFNLLLFLHPLGKHALTRIQWWGAATLGLTVLAALVSLGMWAWVGGPWWALLAMTTGFLCLPVAATFQCPEAWVRWVMAAYTLALVALVTVGAFFAAAIGGSGAAGNVGVAFALGCFFSGWIANLLNTASKKR